MMHCYGSEMGTKKGDPIASRWEATAKNLLKAELKRRGLGYSDLVERLAEMQIRETERNLTNKISRGGFSAAFFLQCLAALGAKDLHLD